jgi:ferritin
MISDKLAKALTRQIGNEMEASQQYLAVATYFALQNLDKWAALFYAQSDEERGHGMKILHFLTDVDVPATLPAVGEAKPNFKSAQDVIQKCLDWERSVTKSFHDMAETAIAEKDYTSFQFLQWFIQEQVEEEALMGKLLDIVKSGIDLFQAQLVLPDHE